MCSVLRIVHVRVLCGVRAINRNVLKHVHVVRKDVRNDVAIIVYCKCS